jgi:hypothetical protein
MLPKPTTELRKRPMISLNDGCRATFGSLPTGVRVALAGLTHRSSGTVAARPEPRASSPAVPLACHIGRATTVPSGQPRSNPWPQKRVVPRSTS